MTRINALIKETQESSLASFACEDTVTRRPSMNQEAGPHQTLNLLAP